MEVVIDRFEGEYAVCEKSDSTMINIEKKRIPQNAKEGDVLVIDHDKIYINSVKTQKRKQEIEKLTQNLWE